MSYDRDQIELAMCGIRVLVIIGAVALVSYAARQRVVFFAGALGSMLGFAVPEPVIHEQCLSVEAAFMASLEGAASHVMFYGVIGATVGCAAGVLISRLFQRRRKRLDEVATA